MDLNLNNELLKAVNNVAAALLVTDKDRSFEDSIILGLESICRCINSDRIYIWQNEIHNGELCFTSKYEWLNENGKNSSPPPANSIFTYSKDTPGWESKFSKNEHINSPVSKMTPEDKIFFKNFQLKSIILIPLFLKNKFWGFFSVDDCTNERTVTDDEIIFLRSAGLMMINAIEHNRQEKKFRETQDYLKLILDATPLACRLWDRDYKILECNNKSVEMFDLSSKQEFIEKYFDLYPEFQPDGENSEIKARKMIKKAFDEGGFSIPWIFQKLNGVPIPSEITLVRVPYGDDYLVAGFTRDLREQNRMMREIEHRDELLRLGNSSAITLLSSMNENKFNISISEGMKNIAEYMDIDRIYIWQNEKINGKMHYKNKFDWISDLGRENNAVLENMALPYSVFSSEFNEKLANGKIIKGALSELPAEDQKTLSELGVKSILIIPMFLQDDFWGVVTFDDCKNNRSFSDEDEDILRSMGLMMINAFIRHEMTKKIISANEAKSDFLARMSHEMRTPLNAVLGLTELTLIDEGLNKETESNLEQIYSAGSTLLSLLNDILDISKIEAGKLELIESIYDVPSLINDSITQNILRIGSKSIDFILNIDKNMFAQLYGDELRIKQILNNLLSNAFKYTEEGTVTLEIDCSRESETVWVTIKVSDTGIGIKPEYLSIIFLEFEQSNDESNKYIEGTGLGLPITKKMVELMGGTITVNSEYKKGSVFTVKIAQKFIGSEVIGSEMAESLKSFRYSDNKRYKNARLNRIKMPYARVLAVDDVITNLNIIKGFLNQYEIKVDCVTTGQKAVEAVKNEKIKYDAIFMDHMMPGMDGIEATRIIREEIGTEYAKNIPIIAFTANAIIGNEELFLNKGFQAFISKPIDIHRLDKVLRHWIRDKSKEVKNVYKNETQGNDDKEEFKMTEIPGINKVKAMSMVDGEIKLFISVLRSFCVNTPEILKKLENVTEDNLNEYSILVHGLKGACAGIGAEKLREKMYYLELKAKSGNISEILNKNENMIQDTLSLIDNINVKLKEYESWQKKPVLPAPDFEYLEKLRICCENYDMNGIEKILELLENYNYENGNDLVEWIKERVEMSEFIEISDRIIEYNKKQGYLQEEIK